MGSSDSLMINHSQGEEAPYRESDIDNLRIHVYLYTKEVAVAQEARGCANIAAFWSSWAIFSRSIDCQYWTFQCGEGGTQRVELLDRVEAGVQRDPLCQIEGCCKAAQGRCK